MSVTTTSRSDDGQSAPFAVAGRIVGDDVLVDVIGDVDLATADMLDDVLRDAVDSVTGDVVLDASKVTFIDSTGLATLVRALRALGTGRSLRLARPSPAVRRPLELANMLELFPLVE